MKIYRNNIYCILLLEYKLFNSAYDNTIHTHKHE